VLLDLNMPGPSPTDTVAHLRRHCPASRVLILSGYDDDVYVHSLTEAGVAGYILKDEATESVVRAIRTVAQCGTWFSRTILDKLMHRQDDESASRLVPLSPREKEVLRLLAEGKMNKEIAELLGISEKTVEKYVGQVCTKLGVTSRVQAAVRAVRDGLV
jgi:DNA-binding NarL/FixJ family response regulator